MKPEIAVSHYMLGKFSSQSIVDLANTWLGQGVYTDSLNYIVMANSPTMVDVGPLLESAIKEQGLEVPTKVEAAKIATEDTIYKIVSGEINLMEGASFRYWDMRSRWGPEVGCYCNAMRPEPINSSSRQGYSPICTH